MDYLDQLDKMFDTKYRLVTIETEDPLRVEELISQLSLFSNKAYYHCLPGQGMYRFGAAHIKIPRTIEPKDLLNHIEITRHFGVYILQDFHPALKNRQIIEQLKNIINSDIKKVVVLLSEQIDLPAELKPFTLRSKHKLRDTG